MKLSILLGVKYFKQSRGGVSTKVRGHFVDLIQHEDGVLGSRFLHGLNDLAGKRADVGAPMPANLRFIAHAAERHADELSPRRFGDRHAERGFSHTRRSDEAKDRAFGILDQLPHRQKLKDAFLDLFQTIVIRVQNLLCVVDAARFLALFLPRNSEQPVQIVSGDGRLGGHRRHRFELLELLNGLFEDILGHACAFDLLAQLVKLALLAPPKLLLDGFDLFVEVILFLGSLHLPLDAALDAPVHVQLFDLDVEHVGDAR